MASPAGGGTMVDWLWISFVIQKIHLLSRRDHNTAATKKSPPLSSAPPLCSSSVIWCLPEMEKKLSKFLKGRCGLFFWCDFVNANMHRQTSCAKCDNTTFRDKKLYVEGLSFWRSPCPFGQRCYHTTPTHAILLSVDFNLRNIEKNYLALLMLFCPLRVLYTR